MSLSWLPADWTAFRESLRGQLPPSPELTEQDQVRLFRAGCAVREAARLMADGDDANVSGEALRVLLRGVFSELGEWGSRIQSLAPGEDLVGRLRGYLLVELFPLRESFSRGDPAARHHLRFEVESRIVSFREGGCETRLPFSEAAMAGFLWWILVTEWCWDRIRME